MGAQMPLDLASQKTVQEFLLVIKGGTGLGWKELHDELNRVAKGRDLSLKTKKMTAWDRLAGVSHTTTNNRSRVKPSVVLATVLLEYWEIKSREWQTRPEMKEAVDDGNARARELSFLRSPEQSDLKPPHDDVTEDEEVAGFGLAEERQPNQKTELPHSFIAALGIDTTVSKKSIDCFWRRLSAVLFER
jgi:hypothetical protein